MTMADLGIQGKLLVFMYLDTRGGGWFAQKSVSQYRPVLGVTKSQDTQCKVSARWSPQHLEVTTTTTKMNSSSKTGTNPSKETCKEWQAKRRAWQEEHTEK